MDPAALLRHLRAEGIRDERVLAAIARVPRDRFVPEEHRAFAWDDRALPIGLGQTISQPYVVAFMTEKLELKGGERVLEVGTGSGYQAAILAELGAEVWSVEIVPELVERARTILAELGYTRVHVAGGDGYLGFPSAAPFDAVLAAAAPSHIPPPLLDQLAVGGRLVMPVGTALQELQLVTKRDDGLVIKNVLPVRFVPMTGPMTARTKR
jgi:protein-L-isoaspartate(D-aspartate) O-methyltransferase